MNWVEVFGIISSIVVFISLSMTNIIKLRVINFFGSLLFAAYGYMIGSFSTTFLNLGIAAMNVFYLKQLYSVKDSYEIVEADKNSKYFANFLEKNRSDIEKFFNLDSIKNSEELFYLIRNNYTAGVLGSKSVGDVVEITIDYVVERFRDTMFGKYIFEEHLEIFRKKGFKKVIQKTENPHHIAYLEKIGFVKEGNGIYSKAL